MRRALLILVSLLGGTCYAQQPDFELLLQGNGTTVNLLWLPQHWPEGVTAVNVKRRVPGGAWQKLNSAPIGPSHSEEAMATRSNDPAVVKRLVTHREEQLNTGKLVQMAFEDFHRFFLKDDASVKMLREAIYRDGFAKALLDGFAFADGRIPKAGGYEYGLFTVKDTTEAAQPSATASWKYGTRHSLSLEFGEPTVNTDMGISVKWKVTAAEVRSKRVREFRAMKRDAKGTVTEVMKQYAGINYDGNEAGFFDHQYPRQEAATFFVVPVDIWDVEGKPSAELAYDETKYPHEEFQAGRVVTRSAGQEVSERPASWANMPQVAAVMSVRNTLIPPADDAAEAALANYPVTLGNSSPEAKNCALSGKPGDPNYCLRPADRMQFWLRADDYGPRYNIFKLWQMPKFLRNWVTAGPQSGEGGWRVSDRVGGLPAITLADRSTFEIHIPFQAPEFTLFVVGRQLPNTKRGTLLMSGSIDTHIIGWRDGTTLQVGKESSPTEFEYPGVTDFHVLALRFYNGSVAVHANNKGVGQQETQWVGEPTFRFVGVMPGPPVSQFGSLRSAFSITPPENPGAGVEIAEMIIWTRVLDDEEMSATQRYLRKKYSLP